MAIVMSLLSAMILELASKSVRMCLLLMSRILTNDWGSGPVSDALPLMG